MGIEVSLGHYLVVSAILLVLGIFGIFLNRKNVIIILMSVELILLAVNLNLVAFSAALGDVETATRHPSGSADFSTNHSRRWGLKPCR